MLLHRLGVWEWMGYAAWAAVHAYIFTSWFNQYEDIYFPHSGHQSHAQKAPHTQQHRGNLSVNVIELDRRSHHHPPRGKGVDAVLQYFDDELLLCSSARLSFVESLEKLQLIMPAVVATYA